MPTYVARVEREGKVLLERADVTVELLEPGQWRARFLLPPDVTLPRKAQLTIVFVDGRQGQGTVGHIHPSASKKAPRLVEITGKGELE